MPISRWELCSPCCSSKGNNYTTSVFDAQTGKFLYDFDAGNPNVGDRLAATQFGLPGTNPTNLPSPVFDEDSAGNIFTISQHHTGSMILLNGNVPASPSNYYNFNILVHPDMTLGYFRFRLRTGIPLLPFVFSNYIPWNATIAQVTAALSKIGQVIFSGGSSLQTGLKYKILASSPLTCHDDLMIDDAPIQILAYNGIATGGSFQLMSLTTGIVFNVPYNVFPSQLASLISQYTGYTSRVMTDMSIGPLITPQQTSYFTLNQTPFVLTYLNLKDTIVLVSSSLTGGATVSLTQMPSPNSLVRKFEPTKGAEILTSGKSLIIEDGRKASCISVSSSDISASFNGDGNCATVSVGGPSANLLFSTKCVVGSQGTFQVQVNYHGGVTYTSRPIQYINNTPGNQQNQPLPNLGIALADVFFASGFQIIFGQVIFTNQVAVYDNANPPNLLYWLVDFTTGPTNKAFTNSIDSVQIINDTDGFTSVHNGTFGSNQYAVLIPIAGTGGPNNHLTFTVQEFPWTPQINSATINFDNTTTLTAVQNLLQSITGDISVSQTITGSFILDVPNDKPYLFGWAFTANPGVGNFGVNQYNYGIRGMSVICNFNSPGTVSFPNTGTDAIVVTINGTQYPIAPIQQGILNVRYASIPQWGTILQQALGGQLIVRTRSYNAQYEVQWDNVSFFNIEVDSYILDPTRAVLKHYTPTGQLKAPSSGYYLQHPSIIPPMAKIIPGGSGIILLGGDGVSTSLYVHVGIQNDSNGNFVNYKVSTNGNQRVVRTVDTNTGLITKSLKQKDIVTPSEFALGFTTNLFDVKQNPFDGLFYATGSARIIGFDGSLSVAYNAEGTSGSSIAFCPDGSFWLIPTGGQLIRITRTGSILVNIKTSLSVGGGFHEIINDLQGNVYIAADNSNFKNIVMSTVNPNKSVFKFDMNGNLLWGNKNPAAFYPCGFVDPYYYIKLSPDYKKVIVHGSRKWKWKYPPYIAQASDTVKVTDNAVHN